MDESRDVPVRQGVAAYYDRLASVYGDGEFFGARRAAVVAEIATDLATARRVLDLGCGNGAFGRALVARSAGATVVGADLSREMLKAARRRLVGRVPVLQADACDLPFRPGSFDLVFMSHVLLLVPDIDRCIAAISHVLASGGKLVATVGAGSWRSTLSALLTPWELQQAEALFAPRRIRTLDDEERATAACRTTGLRPEVRRAPFSADWHALEEWIRIRWFTMLDEPRRTQAELWIAQVRQRAVGLTLQLSETILLATRP